MLRAAALIPPTCLLVLPSAPAAFDDVRGEARAAVARLVGCGARRVVVLVPRAPAPAADDRPVGGSSSVLASGAMRPSLRAAGIPDSRSGLLDVVVGVPEPGHEAAGGAGGPTVVDDVPGALALALLAAAGWAGPVEVVAVGGLDAPALREQGRLLGRDDVALLLVGGLSARRGPDAPLAEDPRAPEVDAVIGADLARIGRPGDAGAHARLASVDPVLATELAISAWAPWQVLLGALETDGPRLDPAATVSVPAGATYAVIGWERS